MNGDNYRKLNTILRYVGFALNTKTDINIHLTKAFTIHNRPSVRMDNPKRKRKSKFYPPYFNTKQTAQISTTEKGIYLIIIHVWSVWR
jgi:hypothetical protein